MTGAAILGLAGLAGVPENELLPIAAACKAADVWFDVDSPGGATVVLVLWACMTILHLQGRGRRGRSGA